MNIEYVNVQCHTRAHNMNIQQYEMYYVGVLCMTIHMNKRYAIQNTGYS